jgi:hypothetical protein
MHASGDLDMFDGLRRKEKTENAHFYKYEDEKWASFGNLLWRV